jgi:hypothetical protein
MPYLVRWRAGLQRNRTGCLPTPRSAYYCGVGPPPSARNPQLAQKRVIARYAFDRSRDGRVLGVAAGPLNEINFKDL